VLREVVPKDFVLQHFVFEATLYPRAALRSAP